MEISIKARLTNYEQNACQLVFLFSGGKLKGAAKKIYSENSGLLEQLAQEEDFQGKQDETLLLYALPGAYAQRILLVGLGDKPSFDSSVWRRAVKNAASLISTLPVSQVVTDALTALADSNVSVVTMAQELVVTLADSQYKFEPLQQDALAHPMSVKQLTLTVPNKSKSVVEQAAAQGLAIAKGSAIAKNLGNLAPNVCTPTYLAQLATTMDEQESNLTTTVLNEVDMESLGMGALLAVSRGSRSPGQLIVMNYQGCKNKGAPIVLVGKGVTFDTGGISLKPSEAMDEMKFDMCGAAAVFGVMKAVATLQLDINLIGIVPAVENMPDGQAARPGDVVTTLSGQTVEILNTDAEGRLILCDALHYAKQFNPSAIIDIATLTGACVVALGSVATAVLGNHQPIINQLTEAGNTSGDWCWQLPIWDEYQQQLHSNFADMANIGGKAAGAITAACFLSRFVKGTPWAHLDIAGTAWKSGKEKGATGRPVPMLMSYLLNQ